MYLSSILDRLQTIRADLRIAYRLAKWENVEDTLNDLTCLYKDIEYMEKKGKTDGKATDRVGEAEAEG
jgi:hypothetical protein